MPFDVRRWVRGFLSLPFGYVGSVAWGSFFDKSVRRGWKITVGKARGKMERVKVVPSGRSLLSHGRASVSRPGGRGGVEFLFVGESVGWCSAMLLGNVCLILPAHVQNSTSTASLPPPKTDVNLNGWCQLTLSHTFLSWLQALFNVDIDTKTRT